MIVRGTPGHAGVDVEGLDAVFRGGKEEHYKDVLEALGFVYHDGQITKKPGSFARCEPIVSSNGEPIHQNMGSLTSLSASRQLILQPYMYPTDVLNVLREIGMRVCAASALPSGAIVWTLEKL